MLFYDNKRNILEDKTVFDEEPAIVRGTVELTEDKTYLIKLFNRDAKIFYRTELLLSDFDQDIRYTIILQKSAVDFTDDPENNKYVFIEKESDFVYFLENCSEFFVTQMPYIQIYNSSKINDMIIRMTVPSIYYNVKPTASTDSFSDIIKQNDDSYSADLKRNGKKALRKNLEPRNSLSYIEVQLDLITRILFQGLDENKDLYEKVIDKIPDLAKFRTAIEENYIFNIKDVDKCLTEIKEGKANVRKAQEDYYKIGE